MNEINEAEKKSEPGKPRPFPARVVHVKDDYQLSINRGEVDGISIGQRFFIYGMTEEEIIDPETGETLGFLELVRGTGKIIHVQKRMATIESDMHTPKRKKKLRIAFSIIEEEEVGGGLEVFDEPRTGDLARPI